MLIRSTWPLTVVVAVVSFSARSTPCSGQVLSSTPPVANPAHKSQAKPLPSLPQSSVSPAIEQFMRRKGIDPSAPIPPSTSSRAVQPTAATRQEPRGSEGLDAFLRPTSVQASMSPRATPGDIAPVEGKLKAADLMLKAAPLAPNDLRFPINLATALRLADARPLIVAAAQTSVWIAEADLTHAKVLWLPTVNFAADYVRHDGGGPDFNKGVMTTPASVNFFYGGAGLTQYVNLTDAIFEPLVAQQILNSRHFDVQTSKNDALLQTADAYFLVHQARGTYAGALYTVERGHDLVGRIEQMSHDLVPKVEVERARNVVADLEQLAASSRQEWRVQSANLTQVLRLDPRAVVEPMEHDHAQITLIDPGRSLDDLMPIALANRPELSSNRALVEAAAAAIRREKSRPLLPSVIVGGFQTPGQAIQGGVFSLGPNSSLNQTVARADVSVQLVWQFENLGIGNMARVKTQRGKESQAMIELRKTQDKVVADVTRASASVQAASARILQADRALRTAMITFNGHLEGLGQTRRLRNLLVLSYRPQEAVYSLVLLNLAFHEYFATVADYNRAQFNLFHSLGYPSREIALLRTPGEIVPVDVNRPSYMPPVRNGPPPATR